MRKAGGSRCRCVRAALRQSRDVNAAPFVVRACVHLCNPENNACENGASVAACNAEGVIATFAHTKRTHLSAVG